MDPEEHQRRGDAADAVFRELVRRVRRPVPVHELRFELIDWIGLDGRARSLRA